MRLNLRFFSLMAAYMRTGAFTSPKLMLPLHTARGFAGAMLTYTIGENRVRWMPRKSCRRTLRDSVHGVAPELTRRAHRSPERRGRLEARLLRSEQVGGCNPRRRLLGSRADGRVDLGRVQRPAVHLRQRRARPRRGRAGVGDDRAELGLPRLHRRR